MGDVICMRKLVGKDWEPLSPDYNSKNRIFKDLKETKIEQQPLNARMVKGNDITDG